MSAKLRFLRQLSAVSGLTLLSRLLGFTRDAVQSAIIGIGGYSDALAIGMMLPSIARKLTSEGLFNAAFVPIYQQLKEKHSPKEADIWASNLLFKLLTINIIVTLLLQIMAPYVLTVLAPGFLHKESWSALVLISRIMFASIIGSTLSSFINTVWTANRQYFWASIGSSVCNVAIIIGSLLSNNIYQLATSVTLGTYVQFIFTVWPMRDRLYFQKSKHSDAEFLKLLWPLLCAGAVLQLLSFAAAWFGSWLAKGEFTYFIKAEKMLLLPISLIGLTLNTILIPTLARRVHHGYVVLSVKIGLLLSAFVFCVAFTCSDALAYLSFCYGKVTQLDTVQIGAIVKILALGMPGWILLKIFQASLAATKNTISNFYGNLIHIAMYITLGLFVDLTATKLAIVSIAATWGNVLFLGYKTKRAGLVPGLLLFSVSVPVYCCLALMLYFCIMPELTFSTQLGALMKTTISSLFFAVEFLPWLALRYWNRRDKDTNIL